MSSNSLISVVIRTLNEERYLAELLEAIYSQNIERSELEVVIVDSGSTDATLEIAKQFGCRVTTIAKNQFTFGRSLNLGCEFAKGEVLVFVSGHCIPVHESWLQCLCEPILDGSAAYTYGRQVGRDTTKYSETRHFEKWFPAVSQIPQEGYFCNNANAAVSRDAWRRFLFNEELSGLEDMYLAKLLTESGFKIGYVADAPVFHIHDENWAQVRVRYERESRALRVIMPEVQFTLSDLFVCVIRSVVSDLVSVPRKSHGLGQALEIIRFRWNQYLGSYLGSRGVEKLSSERKRQYFYPNESNSERRSNVAKSESHRASAAETK